MAELRHGAPVQMDGWMTKEVFPRRKQRRFLKLRGTVLSNHHGENEPATWEVSVVESQPKAGARANEFVIQSGGKKLLYFAPNEAEFKQWANAFKKAVSRSVSDYYRIGPMLGEGAFAEVRMAHDRATDEKFAVKIIKKREYDAREMEFVLREMNIMKSISHPNIVSTYDIFDTRSVLYIIMEFMDGGELFDIIADAGHFSERKASQVARGVISGVAYLHGNRIVHRDMKPENILCKSRSWPLTVKLADFGLANFDDDNDVEDDSKQEITSMIGTPGYVAPEVVKKEKYGAPVDMWACGVILYIMLSGKMPFYGKDDSECLRRIAAGRYGFPDREWKSISQPARNLVRSLLQVDPSKRITAKAALAHDWLDSDKVQDTKIENDFSGIHSTRRKFKKAVYAALTIQRMKNMMNNLAVAHASGELK